MVTTAVAEIDQIRVRTISLDFLLIDWRIKPTNRPVSDFTFSIFRSQSPEGPFNQIVDGLKQTFAFKDFTAAQKARWRKWYYKVRATEDTTSKFSESEVVSNSEKPDRIALAIMRRNNLLLSKKNGIDAFLLTETTFGQRCPNCFDAVKGRKKVSNCTICLATGFIKGFLDPVQIRINVSPSPKVSQFANFGEVQPNQTAAWMSNFPEAKQRDLIIEAVANGTRWRITRVNTTRKNRALVHQNLLLTEINRSDVEWKIQIPELETV